MRLKHRPAIPARGAGACVPPSSFLFHHFGPSMLEPRPEIRGFEPYTPGRSAEQIKREFGLKRVVKLASNENPLGPPRGARAALRRAADQAHLYPDGFGGALRRALAARLKVKPTQVILGAGSDEIIEVLAKAYLGPGDEIVVSENAFIRYRMAGELMGARVVAAPTKNMTHDLEAMAAAVTGKTKFVFVANPNNPTGTYNTREEVEEFLITLPARVVAVMDEAYFEYARARKDYPDSLDFFRAGRNLVCLRTFSKIHGLAGLRVGYGVAPEAMVETLDRVRPPFNVSSPAQAAALAALADKSHAARSLRLVKAEKARLEKALAALRTEWVPSAANFLLINVAPLRGEDVFRALLKKGVIIRAMDEYGFPNHVRVTVGLPRENDLFLKNFTEVRKAL
jgi:histidinol-phosphate aminotransferase